MESVSNRCPSVAYRCRSVALLMLLAACNGSPTEPDRVRTGRPFDLRVGDSALTTDDLRVRFDAVRSDSRCPIDAICVRAGEAERSEEHTSELQSPCNLVCRLLLENKTTR